MCSSSSAFFYKRNTKIIFAVISMTSANVVSLLQHLRDAQERVNQLEAENKSLKQENAVLRSKSGEMVKRDEYVPGARGSDGPGAEKLIEQLQREMIELTKRNTFLEGEMQQRFAALRQRFELHVDGLEMELRRSAAARTRPAAPTNATSVVEDRAVSEGRKTLL